jgi:uncharacterized protein with GYD domain
MPTFITTLRFTPQGMTNIRDTTKRAAAFKAAAKKMGVEIKEQLWTLGPFDCLAVLEAPDDETATALMLNLGALGNVHTQTTRAFTATEMDKILAMKAK